MNNKQSAELNLHVPPDSELQPEQPVVQNLVKLREPRPKRVIREPSYLKDYVRY